MNLDPLRFAFVMLSCSATAQGDSLSIRSESLPELAAAASNNSIALTVTGDGVSLYSFFGLESGKTWQDLSSRGWVLRPGADSWSKMDAVPGATGRLASTAVTAAGAVWLFGGYTVAKDGSEVSTPEVYRVDPGTGTVVHVSDMPVPVDDMVAFAYRDRFIYLVSGWHDLGNVNLVQVLDTSNLRWSQATPYPGYPVFGHAGGMSGSRMLVCDGVRIEYAADGSARKFLLSDQCWMGSVDVKDFRRINWRPVPVHPGPPRYRMAAGADDSGHIIIAGGSTNPYNYDGIGYNGEPAGPESSVFSFDVETGQWGPLLEWREASMDHRNLPFHQGWFYLAGGMLEGQKLTRRVLRFRLDAAD